MVMDDMISNRMDIPKWMATGKTILCQKDPGKGNVVNNYRPISCLTLMWKLMTRIIVNSVYEYRKMYNLPLVEQKGCRRNSRGTKNQLLIDKMVLNDCKKRHTDLGMTWIDYKKAYNMIPYSWILKSLGLVQVSENIVEFIRKSMENCNTNLTSCGKYLTNAVIRTGIFQGVRLSPFLFGICMIPLTEVLRKVNQGIP